jgi:hypothetical protein
MKKYSLYIACTIVACLGMLAYAFEFNILARLFSDQKIVIESNSSDSHKTLKNNLDSIPNYVEPETIKSTLSSDQKKQYSKLNETQQKEALSAMGHQQGIKEVVTYGQIELDRLKESDQELAQKDKRAEDIIQALKAKVASKNVNPEELNSL